MYTSQWDSSNQARQIASLSRGAMALIEPDLGDDFPRSHEVTLVTCCPMCSWSQDFTDLYAAEAAVLDHERIRRHRDVRIVEA